MNDLVLSERRGDVTLLRLNRPEVRNAVNVGLAQAIVDRFGEVAQDGTRAVVLTGMGQGFCAGLDLRNLGADSLAGLPSFLGAVRSCPIPVIGAVNGAAVTGGFELALACDFLIGSPNARFADTHLRVKVYPGPVLVELPRRVGMAWAREMTMTGNFVDAETALRIGILNHLVSQESLLDDAFSLASAIAEQDPVMVRHVRQDWDNTGGMPVLDAHRAHSRYAVEAGYGNAPSSTLVENHAKVVERARTQPGA